MKLALIFIGLLFCGFVFPQDKKNIVLLDNWTDTTLLTGPEKVIFNEVTGFDFDGNHYAALGSNNGTHIFQIKNDKLINTDFVPGKFQNVVAENRDFAVYKNYLYSVCDEGLSSMQIMDLSYLPDSVSVVYDSNILFTTAHTICIDTLNAKLYACGTNSAAMKIFDLTDPLNPVLLTDFTGAAYVHDCHVVNDTAFLNCGFEGLKVYNFSGPVPILLGMLDFYANQGYNHSGYYATSGNQYAFTDETEGTKIKLCYLDNIADIKIDAEFGTSDFANKIPHEIVLLENLLFCAYYNDGLRIFDLTSTPISEIGSYDTFLPGSDFKMNGAWGVHVFKEDNLILMSDRQSGLYLFKFPVKELEGNNGSSSFITNTPFIDGDRLLIPKPYLKSDNLYFSISTISGSRIYEQENYLNWVEIPLNLASGTYIYAIFADEKTLLESGKFIIGN
ncbi:MAG: choice-of-anchor B family protein [Crocinitomicaceae bacterium]|nr:choice-of-anchor B family protein [Crocinitomicaceae bacterium]